jgi:hypothetical protein
VRTLFLILISLALCLDFNDAGAIEGEFDFDAYTQEVYEIVAEVMRDCEGRDETPGPYPISCDCFKACRANADSPSEEHDCVGLCD